MNYVLKVESTFERIRDGDNGALSEYHHLQVRLRKCLVYCMLRISYRGSCAVIKSIE